jgi:hypothetical protein
MNISLLIHDNICGAVMYMRTMKKADDRLACPLGKLGSRSIWKAFSGLNRRNISFKILTHNIVRGTDRSMMRALLHLLCIANQIPMQILDMSIIHIPPILDTREAILTSVGVTYCAINILVATSKLSRKELLESIS